MAEVVRSGCYPRAVTAPEPRERKSATPPTRRSRSNLIFLAVGFVVGGISSIIPLSYDEGNWLAVARRLAHGQTLYRDITENKSPAFFALVRGLDRLPGSYTIARAAWLGLLTALLAWTATRFLRRMELPDPAAMVAGLTIGLAGAMQAVLVLNFELPAMILLVVGMTLCVEKRVTIGGFIAGCGALLDLRTIVLLPGLILFVFAAEGRSPALRTAAGAAIPALAWAIAVLATADLRYSLLELNVATRGGSTAIHPASQLAAFARSMLFPLVAVGALTAPSAGTKSIRNAAWFLLGVGAVVALISVQPFDKYWTLTLPGLLALAGSRVQRQGFTGRALPIALILIALVPSAVYAGTSNRDESAIVARYRNAVPFVASALGPGGTFVRFDSQPFLGTFLPARDRTPAAVLDFLIAPTSHERANLATVDRAISRATAIIDDGALEQPADEILPSYRRLREVFAARLPQFPCVKRSFGLTLHLRPERCVA